MKSNPRKLHPGTNLQSLISAAALDMRCQKRWQEIGRAIGDWFVERRGTAAEGRPRVQIKVRFDDHAL
jgi:hypothetical protein